MKLFRRFSALFTALLICIGCMGTTGGAAVSAADDSEMINHVRQGVVYVQSFFQVYQQKQYDENGRLMKDPKYWFNQPMGGSGFAVGNDGDDAQYIMTNAHVVTDEFHYTCNYVMVFFSEKANKFMEAEIYNVDFERDLCILKLPEPTKERIALPFGSMDNVVVGNKAYSFGYPDYGDVGQEYKTMDVADMVVRDGMVSKLYRVNFNNSFGFDAIMHSAEISHGNSGGPLVNEYGQVIGINTWSTNVQDASAVGSIATNSAEIMDFLDQNKIHYQLIKDPTPTDTTTETTTEATTTTEAVTTTEATTVTETTTAIETTTAPVPVPPPAPNNTVLICVIIVVIAIAIAAVIILGKKKGAAPEPTPAPAPAPEKKTPATATIVGVKGALSGRSFTIDSKAVIGRNPDKCDICFPIKTPGVSEVHCEIRRNGNSYEIVDKNSSHGTFIGTNGQKTVPDLPAKLENGAYFYLGSPEQLFQIKY